MYHSRIVEILSLLYRSRKTIDYLFSKRPNAKHRADLMEYDDQLKDERLQVLTEKFFLQEKNSEYVLDSRLIEFFENYLGVGDATVEMLVADLKQLEEIITYFEVSKDIKYLKILNSTLYKLGMRLSINIQKLYSSIDEVYKTEKDLTIKLMKLKKYETDRDSILTVITDAERFLDLNQAVLRQDIDVNETQKQLAFTLIESRQQLLSLQNQIIDYIHKVQAQTAFYKKITLLKKIKKNDGTLDTSNTNIREVASQSYEQFFYKKSPYRTKVPLHQLLDNAEGRKVVERIRKKLKLKANQQPQKLSLATLSEQHIEENVEIPVEELFELYMQSGEDLFSFIQNYTFPAEIPDLNIKDRISLFVELCLDYESNLVFHSNYQDFTWKNKQQELQTIQYQLVTVNKNLS